MLPVLLSSFTLHVQVKIAKCGVQTTMNYQTTLIAQGNYSFSEYFPDKTYKENISVYNSELIENFDLIVSSNSPVVI